MKPSLTFFLIISLATSSSAQLNKIDSLLEAMANQDRFSGSVLIAKNGKVVYERILGIANRETKTQNDKTTAFSIASIGKMFTATLVMQLVEKGKLNLQTPIATYLPKLDLPNKDKVTLSHLLSHTSGYGNYMAHPQYQNLLKSQSIELDDAIPLIISQPLVFDQPGLRFEYSNSGFILVGKIIEVITGMKYAHVLKRQILDPLKLRSVQYEIDRSKMKGTAIGYRRSNPHDGSWESTAAMFPQPLSDGGLFITATDLFAFEQALFSGKLIGNESLQKMTQTHSEGLQPGMGKLLYGYGLMRTELPNNIVSFGHNGGSPGYGAELRHYRIDGNTTYTLIIQSNFDRVIRPIFYDIQEMILQGRID